MSSEHEKLRVAYHCAILTSGFYQRRGQLIVPKVIPKYSTQCVVMPECVKELPESFWHEAVVAGKTMPVGMTDIMRQAVAKLPLATATHEQLVEIEHSWREREQRYWALLQSLWPDRVQWIGSLEVRLTRYASKVSYYFLERKQSQRLVVHLRDDAGVADLARIIIMALLWPEREVMNLSLTRRMAIADYLMSMKPMQDLFGHMAPSLVIQNIPATLKRASSAYLDMLGVPVTPDLMDILIHNRHVFGEKEWSILLKLVESEGELMSYDEIATILWGDGEFRSFWAINKLVQRIKVKIRKIGVDHARLHVVRGKGCVWGV